MTQQAKTHFAALVSAALVTVGMLASVNHLATAQPSAALLARTIQTSSHG